MFSLINSVYLRGLLLLLCGIVISGTPVQAQKGILTGYIFDAETGDPLPYANVIVEGTSRGSYSVGDGSYKIKLDTGQTQIKYRFISYRDTVVTVHIREGEETRQDIHLRPDRLSMDVTVSANRAAEKVKEIAQLRDQRNSNLNSYKADVYKVAILSNVDEDFEYEQATQEKLEPIAYSERQTEVLYTDNPERYSETIVANRASENFFSEYDFFSTGGAPLNLNANEVPLSILSESITVVGPVSDQAGRFYDIYDDPADSTWPSGTIQMYFEPKKDNRPLFEGYIWYNENESAILKIDVGLNDYANTNTGTFKISDLRYQQSYEKVGDFWLPERTELSAMLRLITSKNPIYYHDEWTWKNFKINRPGINPSQISLNTTHILPDAHKKESTYWDSLSGKKQNQNAELLDEADNYEEDRVVVRLGMSALSSFFRLPYQMKRFYLTNFSDIYHYNRVEGHFLGIGLRTPVHPDYDYRLIGGYGFGNKSHSYEVSGHHYLGGWRLAPEFSYHKEIIQQYQDYEYNRTPIDFFETRQTITALFTGSSGNNYFEREGYEAGFRFRFSTESFLRILYQDEEHQSLSTTSDISLLGNDLDSEEYLNNDPDKPAEPGTNRGLYVHLHHDTRQYQQLQFLRDYNIREFGWLADMIWEKGLDGFDSDFDFNRYRLGLKFYWPVFTSHFFQTDIVLGAADSGTPNQRLFTYNGFVVDDYVRYRPFNTISYREPISNRVTQIKIRYKFGSSITRSIPIGFIRRSGIQISTVLTGGVVDEKNSLEPLLPYSGSSTQAEAGIVFSKIFGIFYAEFSKKLYGKYGNSYGISIIF